MEIVLDLINMVLCMKHGQGPRISFYLIRSQSGHFSLKREVIFAPSIIMVTYNTWILQCFYR